MRVIYITIIAANVATIVFGGFPLIVAVEMQKVLVGLAIFIAAGGLIAYIVGRWLKEWAVDKLADSGQNDQRLVGYLALNNGLRWRGANRSRKRVMQ